MPAKHRFSHPLIFGLLLLLCATFAHSQNIRVDGVAQSRSGAPAPGAFVAVCTQPAITTVLPCTPPAPLCSSTSDVTCTSPNPVQADGLGNYHFYMKTGSCIASAPCTMQFYGSTVTTGVLPDQSWGGGGAGSGTITGVVTNSGSGLLGGALFGTLNMSLLNCSLNQVELMGLGGWNCASGLGNVSTTPPVNTDQAIVQEANPSGVSTKFSANNFANIRYVTSSWTWAYTDTGGALGNLTTPGSVTVTLPCTSLAPCPLGTDTNSAANHYIYKVYISGTGTPEAALVTGGSCTPAATTSCTLTLTTANAHSNGYTVGSASSGIQEAINDAWVGDTSQVPYPSSSAAPYVKLQSNTQYDIWASVYLRSRGAVLDGAGALWACHTRDRCLYIGITSAFPAANHHKVRDLNFSTTVTQDGAQVASVSAASGTYTVTTASTHGFVVGDTVDCEYHSQNSEAHWTSVAIAPSSGTTLTVQFGSSTFSTSANTFGWCNILNAAIEDNSDAVAMDKINIYQIGTLNGAFSYGVVDDNDQQLVIEKMANRSTFILQNSANFPNGAMVYERNDQGMNGIVYLHDSELSNVNCVTAGGNGLVVSDTVCQGFPLYGIRYFGGLQPSTFSNVYEESTGGTDNKLYHAVTGSFTAAQMGDLVTGGRQNRIVGSFPTGGLSPTFPCTGGGSNTYNYFVVPHSSTDGYGPALYVGQAVNCTGNILIAWPSVELQDHASGTVGTLLWDVLRTTGAVTPPYGTGNFQIANQISGSCSASGMCSYTDTQAAATSYTFNNVQFSPEFWFWPTNFVVNYGAALQMDECDSVPGAVASIGANGVSLICGQIRSNGLLQQRSPIWMSTFTVDGISGQATLGSVLQQKDLAGASPSANSKGRLNFGSAITAPNDLITLQDSNFAKTMATAAGRPSNDANDIALGIDVSGGLNLRAQTSITQNIGAIPTGTNFLTQLTSNILNVEVPLNPSSLGTGTNNRCFVDGMKNANIAACATSFKTTNSLFSGFIYSNTPEDFTINPYPSNFSPQLVLGTGLNSSICDTTHVNCWVTEVPLVALPGYFIEGTGVTVLSTTLGSNHGVTGIANLSSGTTLVTGNNYPPPLGVPTEGTIGPCANTGGSLSNGTYYFYVRTELNLWGAESGPPPAVGPSMHTAEVSVICSGGTSTQSIPIPSPSAVGTSPFQAQDFAVAVSTVSGGEQLQPNDATHLSGTAGVVDTTYGVQMGNTATLLSVASPTRFMEDTDKSNCLLTISPLQAISFNVTLTGITLNAGPVGSASSFNTPNWMICNDSGQELSAENPNGLSINGPSGGYCSGSPATGGSATPFSGGYIYEGSQTPNGALRDMTLNMSAANGAANCPFYPLFLDGRPDNTGSAAGVPRLLDNITITPRYSASGYVCAAIYATGSRARIHATNIHIENTNPGSAASCFGTVAATGITADNGAYVDADADEVFVSTSGVAFNLTSTGGGMEVRSSCSIGTANASQGKCLGLGQNSSSATFLDQTVTPNRKLLGYVQNALSGTSALLTSVYTNATATPSTIFAFPIAASQSGTLHCHGLYKAAASGYFGLTVTGPASPTAITYEFRKGTAIASAALTELDYPGTGTSYPTSVGATAVTTAATDMPWDFYQQFVNGTTAGNFVIEGYTVSTDTLTVEIGSSCQILP